MKCPSCGKEVSENKSYCDGCGSSLYGPRSINLNDLGGGSNTIQSNNIKSITGIDINDIAPIQNSGPAPVKRKKEKKYKAPKQGGVNINIGTIIFLLVIACLLIVCIYLFIQNKKLKEEQKPLVTPPAASECIEGYYGITSTYAFLLPENWIYSQTSNEYGKPFDIHNVCWWWCMLNTLCNCCCGRRMFFC